MLDGRRIAVPESRELDLFTRMLERQGAVVVRCPLVSIHDVQDSGSVDAWLDRLVQGRHEIVVLYTGEGLSRLLGFARRKGIEADVIAALRKAFKVARGPKPAKVLRGIGLAPDLMADEPTTAGLMKTLSAHRIEGRRIGILLYPGGEEALPNFLEAAGAQVDPVLSYRYASDEEDGQVLAFIQELASGTVDLIAFTSTAQVRRLQEVARRFGQEADLDAAMRRILIAAVGPVTAEAVEKAGWPVGAMPQDSYHLKPLVMAFGRKLSAAHVSPA
ncbi:uroporphyrinogen-III synthase [Microvirga tunisiensis]|uniref:Uroporphyrinogen-III synthase n=1 Tax=Microvirga tunisiensis TaxID=2108360 RepID=A0A5N7MLX6_9HYPH|nr:uroporphyrinogen-III synthase [Microvirga tunisiensis]MPR09424.1 uroporphyrinogen-III synthase [Microvirga tunisiensis]MPR27630.1 uroporphyrinogen-III synthase [Microvirga tunisiensis]